MPPRAIEQEPADLKLPSTWLIFFGKESIVTQLRLGVFFSLGETSGVIFTYLCITCVSDEENCTLTAGS